MRVSYRPWTSFRTIVSTGPGISAPPSPLPHPVRRAILNKPTNLKKAKSIKSPMREITKYLLSRQVARNMIGPCWSGVGYGLSRRGRRGRS